MRNMVTDRTFVPSTLGVRGLDTSAGNRLHGEAIRKGIHPYWGRKGWPYGFAVSKLQEHRPQEGISGLPRGTSAREHAHAITRRRGRE